MTKSTHHELEINGVSLTLIERQQFENGRPNRHYWKNTRVYGAIPTLAPEEAAELDKWTSPPVTHQMKEEQPEEAARIMKGYSKAKRAATRAAAKKLNDILDVGSLGTQGIRVKNFSIHAGCSCPCSPGFILDGDVRWNDRPVDIWINDPS